MNDQDINTVCGNIRDFILENIPNDASDDEVLQIFEHTLTMLDRWSDVIRERISDSYVALS